MFWKVMFGNKEFLCKQYKEITCIGCKESVMDRVQRKCRWIMSKVYQKNITNDERLDEWNWNYEDEWWNSNEWISEESKFKIPEIRFENFEKICTKEINGIFIVNEIGNAKEYDEIKIPVGILKYSQKKINPLFRGGIIRESVYETKEKLMKKEIEYGKELPLIEICMYENKV